MEEPVMHSLLDILDIFWALPVWVKSILWLVSMIFILGEATLGAFIEKGVWIVNRVVDGKKYNDLFHTGWTVQRAMMYIPWFILWAAMFHWMALFGILATVCWFIFTHDGFYYYFRDLADGSYPLRFKDVSAHSSAKTYTFAWYGRCALLFVGTLLMFFMIYFHYSLTLSM